VLHLAFTNGGANVGLSVSSWARNQGIGTLLLQRAGLLACAQGLKTLFVRNLNFNSALQQLAQRLGMNAACTHNALITRTEMSEPNGHDIEHDGFCGKITLVDYSLRSSGTAHPSKRGPSIQRHRSFPRQSRPYRPGTWRFSERRCRIEASSQAHRLVLASTAATPAIGFPTTLHRYGAPPVVPVSRPSELHRRYHLHHSFLWERLP
jgi:hypothetical protein